MDLERQIARVRGNAPGKSPNVRKLAAYSRHGDCNMSTLGLVARIDYDQLLADTGYESEFGQDPQAIARGVMFEAAVKGKDYAALLALLREKAHFPITSAKIVDVRVGTQNNRQGLVQRAVRTREELKKIARGAKSAANLIDGAVLTCEIAGKTAYFEADGLAASVGNSLQVVEIKNFHCTDGRCDNEKLGAACDQAGWYALLCRMALAALGLPESIVSDTGFIILPEGIGLRPTLLTQYLGAKIQRAQNLLEATPAPLDVLDRAGHVQFPEVLANNKKNATVRLRRVEAIMDEVGTAYNPNCLQDCGLARLCRSRAHQAGQPSMCGSQVVSFLPGVNSLNRAAELAKGKHPTSDERHAANMLVRANAIYARAVKGGAL